MSDAVNGRSAARCRSTIVRQNDTFQQIRPTLGCRTSQTCPSTTPSADVQTPARRLPDAARRGQ
eukprot:5947278-Prymnesium_polylepis.1